jgi:ABC-type Fe3+-hydroxamate transport system substrate-binding protein
MAVFIDQCGRSVSLQKKPLRIVSCVPSQTELLFDLGLAENIVGITSFCIHPSAKTKGFQTIGGTKNLRIKKIKSLQPDLIIGNKEENEKEQIECLAAEFSVWLSDVKNLDDALLMINTLGEITQTQEKALEIVNCIARNYPTRDTEIHSTGIYLIWKNPFMVAGSDTFINEMMAKAGLLNLIDKTRYPQITVDEIIALKPKNLLLSTEPYAFNESDVAEWKLMLPDTHVKLVNGEAFSWYGSRLCHLATYFKEIASCMQ